MDGWDRKTLIDEKMSGWMDSQIDRFTGKTDIHTDRRMNETKN